MEEAAAYLVYQIIENVSGIAYQVYSNWESDIPARKLTAKVKQSDELARVAVIGLGGAGKTTLIKTLTGCPDINPKIATLGICPVILGREERVGWSFRKKRTSIVYCDTEGQRQEDFITSILKADESEILHQGCFEGLIIVLDIKAPAKDMHRDAEIVDAVQWDRLGEHVREWSDVALRVLFTIMSKRLKLCLIFINKGNLVRELSGPESHHVKTKILDEISPLLERLQPLLRGVLVKVILGSARDVEDVGEVRHLIHTRALTKEV